MISVSFKSFTVNGLSFIWIKGVRQFDDMLLDVEPVKEE